MTERPAPELEDDRLRLASLTDPPASAPLPHVHVHDRWARRRGSGAARESLQPPAPRAGPSSASGDTCSTLALRLDAASFLELAEGGGGGLWANVGALLLAMAAPAALAALLFGLPYNLVQHNDVADAFLSCLVCSIGPACSMSVWCSLFLRLPLRRVAPTYVPLFLALLSALFTALNAIVDLSAVPFAYLACIAILFIANSICTRLHARLFPRHSLHPSPRGGPAAGDPDAARAPPPDPFAVIKIQMTTLLILSVLSVYLFLFGSVQNTFLQVAINAANSFLCLRILLVFLSTRAFGRPLAAAAPHGDAGVVCIMTWLLCVRLFRQLSFFPVRSVYVYLASLAADVGSLLLPAPLLLRLAGPLARRAPDFLRLVFVDPPDTRGLDVDPAGLPLQAAPAKDAPPRGAAHGAGVEVRSLDGEGEEEAGRAPRPRRPPPEEELRVFSAQAGVRSMLLWHALVSWTAAAVFSVAVLVARWGPAAATFPYSPATFDDAARTSALLFSLLTAGVHAAVVAAFHVAARFNPRLRDRLGLAASWRFLRRQAPTLALTFLLSPCMSFLILYRRANIYAYVFPDSYPPGLNPP